MFQKLLKKNEKGKNALDHVIEGIEKEENQIELIDMIRKGKIDMKYKGSKLKILPTTQYYKELWVSSCKRIKFWHEDPGFMSFSYLKINGVELIDDIKYGSHIALTIQNPKRNYVVSEARRNHKHSELRYPSFKQFIENNTKK